MKKKKSRLIVSLLTAFIMAFTVFPYMGAGNVSAETDPYVYDNSAKWNSFTNNNINLVKSIKYEPQSDGTFDATIDINTFACQQVIDGQDFIYFEGIGYSYNTRAGHKRSYLYHDYFSSNTSYPYTVKGIVPGETWTFWAWLSWDDAGQDPYLGCDFEELTLTAPQLKPEDCIHSWSDATCTVAKKCKVCGTTSGSALGHTYADATCTVAKKCSVCGTTSGSALGHTYTNACDTSCNRSGCTFTRTTTHSYSNGACTVCGAADPSVKVEAAKDKALGSVTIPKGDYTKKEYPIGQLYLDKSVDTLTFYGVPGTLVIRDSSGNKVISGKEFFYNEDIDQYFAKAGMYKVYAETSSTSGIQDYTYDVTYTLTKDIIYSYKYPSLTATATESGMDNVPAVKIEYGDFDGPSGSVTDQLAIFREANGKIRKLDTSYYTGLVDTIKIDYGTQYTYYIVDLSYVTGTAKTTLSNVGTVDETLTDAIRTALTDSHVTKSNTVTTKARPIATMWYVRVAKQAVKGAEIEWDAINGYVSNYTVDIINSKGETVKTYAYDGTSYPKLTVYVPYEGTSTVKVTPYYEGVAGTPMTQTVESAKIAAAGGHVTKISSTNARIVATRSPGADGLQVQQKVGKKWKNVTSSKGTTVKEYKKTWKKNKAGKTSYRFRSYVKDAGKTYYSGWKTYKPKANVGTYSKWAVSYIRDLHGALDVYFYPTKIEYKGSKIKVTGRFISTWYAAYDKGKFKVTFKVDGKSIGYKTITCKKIKGNSAKTTTFYLSGAKKGKDLRSAGYSVKTYY